MRVAAVLLILQHGRNVVGNNRLFVEEELAVCELEGLNILLAETAALQTDAVDGAELCGVALCNHVRSYVLCNACAAAYHGVVANAYKLVQGSATTDNSPVADDAVPGNTGVSGKDAVVAYLAFMATVAVNQEKVMTADDGLCLRCGGTVDVAILTEDVVIAHFQIGGFTFVFKVLSFKADVVNTVMVRPLPP